MFVAVFSFLLIATVISLFGSLIFRTTGCSQLAILIIVLAFCGFIYMLGEVCFSTPGYAYLIPIVGAIGLIITAFAAHRGIRIYKLLGVISLCIFGWYLLLQLASFISSC
jgi:hypothetical protein